MYLADRVNGTHIIDITTINGSPYPYLTAKLELGEVAHLDQDAVNLYAFGFDSSVAVYNTMVPEAPVFVKKLGPWATDDPTFTALTERFALVFAGAERYVYDIWSPVYSSLYYSYTGDATCKTAATKKGSWDQQYFYQQCDSIFYRYQMGAGATYAAPYAPQDTYTMMSVTVPNVSLLDQTLYIVQANITATNGQETANHRVLLDVYNFGEFITYNATNDVA